MIKYLLEKEFKQLLRNPMLPRMLLVFPCIILLVLPWAANFEIKNMNLSIVDNDRSPYSTRLVQKVGASEYFHLIDVSNNYQEAMQCIEKGDADLILEIPPHFERDLLKTGVAKVLVSANTVNGTKGTLGSSYLSNIVNAYATEIRISHSGSISPSPVIKIDTQGRFNPYLEVDLRLAALGHDLVDELDDLLDLNVCGLDGGQHGVLVHLVGAGLDHHDLVHGSGNGQGKVAHLALLLGGVQHDLAVNQTPLHAADGAVPRNIGHGGHQRSADHAGDLGAAIRVKAHDGHGVTKHSAT